MSTEAAAMWTQFTMQAAAPAAGAAGGLPINAFDFLLLITLGVGVFVGRRRGMSQEMLDVFEWLLIVVISSEYYELLGNLFASKTGLPLLYSYLGSYAFLAFSIKAVFTTFKVKAGEKVIGSDIFGSWEYYLGMVGGMIRFACILLALLALVHAFPFSEAEIAAAKKQQEKELGSSFFPSFGEVQHGIFVGSFSGPFIRKHLADQLIVPTHPKARAGQPGAPSSRKERHEQRKSDDAKAAKAATNAPAAPDSKRK